MVWVPVMKVVDVRVLEAMSERDVEIAAAIDALSKVAVSVGNAAG